MDLGFLQFLIFVVVVVFALWLLTKTLKSWKVSWVGIVLAFILAFGTVAGSDDLALVSIFIFWPIYYLIAVIIFKALKEIRVFFTKKK